MTTGSQGSSNKFGARIFLMEPNVILVMQTVKKGLRQNSPYVVDQRPAGIVQRFVETRDDEEIADAVRAALQGKLQEE